MRLRTGPASKYEARKYAGGQPESTPLWLCTIPALWVGLHRLAGVLLGLPRSKQGCGVQWHTRFPQLT